MGDLISHFLFQPPSPPTPLRIRSSSHGSHAELIWLDTARGSRIPGLYITRKYAVFTILYSHGNAEDLGLLYDYLLDMSKILHVNIMTYDYTGYGFSNDKKKNSPPPSEKDCYADITAAYEYLVNVENISPRNIVLYGRSVGSGPSCYLACKLSDCACSLEAAENYSGNNDEKNKSSDQIGHFRSLIEKFRCRTTDFVDKVNNMGLDKMCSDGIGCFDNNTDNNSRSDSTMSQSEGDVDDNNPAWFTFPNQVPSMDTMVSPNATFGSSDPSFDSTGTSASSQDSCSCNDMDPASSPKSQKDYIGGLILHSPFTSIYRIVVDLGLDIRGDMFCNIHRIPHVRCPVFLVHGTQDEIVPFSHGKALFEAAPDLVKVMEPFWAEGAGHNDVELNCTNDFVRNLMEFLQMLRIKEQKPNYKRIGPSYANRSKNEDLTKSYMQAHSFLMMDKNADQASRFKMKKHRRSNQMQQFAKGIDVGKDYVEDGHIDKNEYLDAKIVEIAKDGSKKKQHISTPSVSNPKKIRDEARVPSSESRHSSPNRSREKRRGNDVQNVSREVSI